MVWVVLVHDLAVLGHQLFHVVGLAEGGVVFALVKLGGGTLVVPIFGHGVVVEGQTIHVLAGNLHHGFGPLVVVGVGAAGDAEHLVVPIVAHVGLVPAVLVCVELRPHIAAAAPVLIAHTEVLHLPGLFLTVLPAEVCHGGLPVKGHVLHPLAHFLHSAGAHVSVDVGLATHLTAELHELMGAKGVVLHHAAPMGVDHALTGLLGANAVLPVVLVGKAAPRPTEYRQLDVLQGFYHVGAHAVDVGNGRVLAHKNAVVNAAAQML